MNGSKHLEFLVEKKLLNPKSLSELEALYAKRVSQALEDTSPEKPTSEMAEDVERSDDRLLLEPQDAKKLATILDAPELVLETERAIFQVREQQERDRQRAQKAGHMRDANKTEL